MVIPKATSAFSRNAEIYDTTLGWRFVNPLMEKMYGTDSMAETGEYVAEAHGVTRESQDRFALASQQKCAAAQAAGVFAEEIDPVNVPGPKGSVKQSPWTSILAPTPPTRLWQSCRRPSAKAEP